ncbi:MAG: UDP-N-acetylmuramate dehydrogenase [Gammaproteobacteria bacterium]|nr:UDP-N-acetylmuramate dehydrogenase [Gammaproteobacteria bacterium]
MADPDQNQGQSNNGWVNLTELTTMKVEAYAKALVQVDRAEQLVEALTTLKQTKQNCFVLGEGSNTVFIQDFDGVVIRIGIKGIELQKKSNDSFFVKVSAGENWHSFVEKCVDEGWNGLENLALIPGTVGAAPIQNIGAYGVEVQNFIESVEVIDMDTLQTQQIAASECGFAYRDSRFKHDWSGKKIVTAVVFRLKRSNEVVLDYPALKAAIEHDRGSGMEAIVPKTIFDAVVAIRSSKLPNPSKIPNSGSFFKNPIVEAAKHDELKATYKDLVSYPYQDRFKLAAAWLIDNAGWKQKELCGIKVHQSQALVITNPNRMPGTQIKIFAETIKRDILDKFGVELEIEPVLV